MKCVSGHDADEHTDYEDDFCRGEGCDCDRGKYQAYETGLLRARIAAMREALEPFAAFSDAWNKHPLFNHDDELYAIHSGADRGVLRLSDCYRAAALLKESEE